MVEIFDTVLNITFLKSRIFKPYGRVLSPVSPNDVI